MCSPRRRLGSEFEPLEPRTLPTAFGIPWADPGHLTLSFAPDGTDTPRGPSARVQALDAGPAWQREVLRAFQTWAVTTNVNIGLVRDVGQPLGTPGAVQGDTRFGDVRIAAAPLTDNVLASSSPFSWTGTTFSGDLLFNSHSPIRIGPSAGTYDVFSVALHEAGHVFGLDHTDAAESVLNETYTPLAGLAGTDVAAVQTIYGVRAPDANDAVGGNDSAVRATALKASGLTGRVVGDGDLSTAADVDFYKFSTLPTLGLTSVTVRLQAAGLSLLTPRVTVFNSAGQVVAQGASTDPLNNDVTLKFANGFFGGSYTVKVEGATEGVFGIGAHHLVVDTVNLTVPIPLVSALLAPVVDGHLNDTLASATDLGGLTTPKPDQRFDATFRGVIENRSDTDNYKVRAPSFVDPGPVALNVMVWGTEATPLAPRLRVFDGDGNPVAFRVLANEGGLFSIEVGSVTPGANYYVSVAAQNPNGTNATGSYFLGADFNQFAKTTYDAIGAGTVRSSTSQTATIKITDPGVFQFALAAASTQPGGGVTMTVEDSMGRFVFTLNATAGQPLVTTTPYLAAGTYTVRYTYRGSNAVPVRFDLFLLRLSRDVGTYSSKTTRPSSESTSSNDGYSYDSSSATPPAYYPYYF